MLIDMVNLLAKLKSKRRWMQFSLRTGLIAVTALCVTLSVWVVPAERQRRAVAAIRELGGDPSYEPYQARSEAFPVAFLRDWLPPDYFDQIYHVSLDNTQITDAGLSYVRWLPGLQGLTLRNTQINDAGLAHLQALTQLRWLNLKHTRVTDAGLAHLQGLTDLQALYLNDTKVTDAESPHLQGLTGLEELFLDNTKLTDAG